MLVALASALFAPLVAQCPDGSPPPCASTRAPPDPNRIAIFPFRVTTSDTLLGEGFAELLAGEFNGEGAPSAVDMGTVVNAWRRAGGGPRAPLPRARLLQLGRDMGAGVAAEGSIVGLGKQITISVALLNVATGQQRGSLTRVTTSFDSLESALRQAAIGMIGTLGGQQRMSESLRSTTSPEAMRIYLAGVSLWRSGKLPEASAEFDRAIALDSAFARAVYRRYVAQAWGIAPKVSPQMLFDRRSLLPPRERIVVEALLGTNFPAPRSIEERFADRERAVSALPDSPEALFWLGDLWFHFGAMYDPTVALSRARTYLERSVAADTQIASLEHVFGIAVRLRDTVSMRVAGNAYARHTRAGQWQARWATAALTGDATTLAALRQRPEYGATLSAMQLAVGALLMADVGARVIDEYVDRTLRGSTPAGAAVRLGMVNATHGRPAAAERTWKTLSGDDAVDADLARIDLDLADQGAGLDAQGATSRIRSSPVQDSLHALGRCLIALHESRGDQPIPSDIAGFANACRWGFTMLRLSREPLPADDAALSAADSTLRYLFVNINQPVGGYSARWLAREWERRGNIPRALQAIRYRAIYNVESPWNYRVEGRLAALAGDTTGAIRAYRLWLQIMRDAEPPGALARDSVRAALATLIHD